MTSNSNIVEWLGVRAQRNSSGGSFIQSIARRGDETRVRIGILLGPRCNVVIKGKVRRPGHKYVDEESSYAETKSRRGEEW
jgi:hypothetical protein